MTCVAVPLATPGGRRSGGGLNVADGVGERGRSGLAFVPGLGVGPNEHGLKPRLALASRMRRGWFAEPLRPKYPGAASRRLVAETLLIQATPIHGVRL